MKNLPIKRELNSIEEVTKLLSYTRALVPESMQNVIDSQLIVLNYVQSPTLVDSTFTTLIVQYEHALKCANNIEIEDTKKIFQRILHNFVFYIDAKTQYAMNKNSALGRKLLVGATEMLNLTIRDVIRASLHLCVATGKIILAEVVANKAISNIVDVAETTMDHIEFMHMDTVISLSDAARTIKTTINRKSTDIEEKAIDSQNTQIISDYSNKSQEILSDVSKNTTSIVRDETAKQYERSTSAMDRAHAAIDTIVVNDLFGEEMNGKKRSFMETLYDWICEDENNKKLKENFNLSIHMLIDKLIKYKTLIGPSVIVSDMIERYLPNIEEELTPRYFTIPWYYFVITVVIEMALSLLVAIGRFVFYSNKEEPSNWFVDQMLCVTVIAIITCCCLAVPAIIKYYKDRKVKLRMKEYRREANFFNPYSE